jgi:hypothetical protein
MKLLKPRSDRVRLSFSCPAELAERLKSIEEKAKALTLDFQLDEQLTVSLKRLVSTAEKELASAAKAIIDPRINEDGK